MPRALEGIRVLDLSRILAGPFATQMLADLGADVVKVEAPWGDDTRRWGPPFIGEDAAYFHSCNRGKRSITLDLFQSTEVLHQLIAACDVLVENFKPGTLERLGITEEMLEGKVPCRISGFGQTGPRRDEPGYDVALQGMTGIMSVTGETDGAPVKVGVAWIDVLTGLTAGNAILAALFHRERTSEGQIIDLSLYDVALMAMVNQAQNWIATGEDPGRMGHAHPNLVPYQAFEASDAWFILATGNDAQFEKVCNVLGLELWQDEELQTNAGRIARRAEVIGSLGAVFETNSASHWIAVFNEAGVPATPINAISDAFTDAQAAARDALWELPSGPSVANALRFMSATPAAPAGDVPSLGEHTDEVMSEWLGA